MPRKKRWRVRLTVTEVPTIDPNNRNAVADDDLVRFALEDFEELDVLSRDGREQLVEDLVNAIRYNRAGLRAQKRGVSDQALETQVFFADVRRALERAGLRAMRWRKQYDNGGGESFYYRVVREIADVSGITIPKDPEAGRSTVRQVPAWRDFPSP